MSEVGEVVVRGKTTENRAAAPTAEIATPLSNKAALNLGFQETIFSFRGGSKRDV